MTMPRRLRLQAMTRWSTFLGHLARRASRLSCPITSPTAWTSGPHAPKDARQAVALGYGTLEDALQALVPGCGAPQRPRDTLEQPDPSHDEVRFAPRIRGSRLRWGGGVENFPPQNEFIGRPPPRQTRLVTLLEVKGGRWVYESKVLKSGLPLKSLIFRKAALGPLVILSCFFASDSPL